MVMVAFMIVMIVDDGDFDDDDSGDIDDDDGDFDDDDCGVDDDDCGADDDDCGVDDDDECGVDGCNDEGTYIILMFMLQEP